MEGCHVLKVSLSVKTMKSEKAYRESQLRVIVAAICALLNSGGGNLNVILEDKVLVLAEEVHRLFRMVEQRVVDIIGSCIFHTNVKPMSQRLKIAEQLVLIVYPLQSLCTVDYSLYLPTQTEVIPISPWEVPERVKALLTREVPEYKPFPPVKFVRNQKVPFEESDSIQFKFLKDESTKCVCLADRITNKSNKLDRYISAFANNSGGVILYGITDERIIKGEIMEQKDQNKIVRKVSKVINQMIWCGGKLERGKHWDIHFIPVKDENMKEIPSLFVIIVSVAPLPGGLFTTEPESYHVVQGRVERMSFTEWGRRFFDENQPTKVMVPRFVGRTMQWSSVKTQRICHSVLQQLLKYQNDGDSSSFENFTALAEQKHNNIIEVKLTTIGEKSVVAYKKGNNQKAKSLVAQFDQLLSKHKIDEVFMLRAVYAKSAIARAEGEYQTSYDIAQEGFQLAERVPAGIHIAWFYNHVAIVEKRLSMQKTKEAAKRALLVQSAQDHFIKALQHTQASSVEQEFPITIDDLQQRIHIFRAITLLGDFASGANFRKATPSDIKAAETDLTVYHRLVVEGHSPTNYRKIYYRFAISDLRLCQWWQQRKQQTQEVKSSEVYKTPNLLKQAFDFGKKAKKGSKEHRFEELTNYANQRLAVITEMMITLNYVSTRRR